MVLVLNPEHSLVVKRSILQGSVALQLGVNLVLHLLAHSKEKSFWVLSVLLLSLSPHASLHTLTTVTEDVVLQLGGVPEAKRV